VRWVSRQDAPITSADVPTFLSLALQRTGEYRFDPERDILIFYAAQDADTHTALQTMFPEGRSQERMSYQGDDSYGIYRVPALGKEGFEAWLGENLPG
jgi:hypothetical protein